MQTSSKDILGMELWCWIVQTHHFLTPHVLSEDTQVNLYRQSFLRQSLFLLRALPTLFELSTETSGAAPVLNQDQVYFYNVYLYVKNAVTVPDKTTEFHTCTEKSIVHKLKFYLFKSKWFSYNKIYILKCYWQVSEWDSWFRPVLLH